MTTLDTRVLYDFIHRVNKIEHYKEPQERKFVINVFVDDGSSLFEYRTTDVKEQINDIRLLRSLTGLELIRKYPI